MKYAAYLLAGGAVVVGLAIWFGTSGAPSIHVGDAGVGVAKGAVRYIPWHGVESVRYERGAGTVVVQGKDDAGAELSVPVAVKGNEQAAAWIVKLARERARAAVDAASLADAPLPEPLENAGVVEPLEALQVVGKRCAESGKILAYEPDARVCPQCERVYHKSHVPETCRCGASLTGLRAKKAPKTAGEASAESTNEKIADGSAA